MAHPRTPRAAWIEAGLQTLAEGGASAVRVEALAKRLGVTKGGFYGYFADRDALLVEMLEAWERDVTETLIDRVNAAGGDARQRLRSLFRIVSAEQEATAAIEVQLAIRDWSRHDPAVATRLRRVDGRQLDYLRDLFGEFCDDPLDIEVRCTVVISAWLAAFYFIFDHPQGREAVSREILDRMLR